ncbi:MAG: protein phosphatase 2C domain-containing protein [Gallionellaceae bacterium]|jgi:serine/threonine protein phosphatase PrpC|nr:protein phosphatase 2C domain-containing protein [Gallionellaceae bacterium]
MFTIAYTHHRGKRSPHQQDALWNGRQAIQEKAIASAAYPCHADSLLLAVADGIANSPSPHLASRFVIETLGQMGSDAPLTPRLVRDIHGRLCDRYAKGKTLGSTTTLVAARCAGDACEIVNVGDSRAYRISATGEWTQLSRDHTLLNDLIDEGMAESGVEYAGLYQMLAHCLAADHEEDSFAVHHCRTPFLRGDNLLLCSDGLHDVLSDEKLCGLFDASISPLDQVKRWRKAVMAAGAPDNFSIILARRG